MLSSYSGILIMFVMATAASWLFIVLTTLWGPKKTNPVKEMPFECGKTPFELPTGRHAVRFYLAGMLFVLFDIELIFFFPWAVVYRRLGLFGFIEMIFFIGLLVLGFIYAWRKGALEWK
ncbi:MAG: NADH-quinone oxidoreductase subunit A [Candidatus Omnitrophica bacterium]|nr:NADH-quinone oxidoreductase subunit A [Candidatus Omnitrophota bacterium]